MIAITQRRLFLPHFDLCIKVETNIVDNPRKAGNQKF